MKVLHVIPAVAPRYGGPSYAVLGMVDALRRQGVEALIATTDADGSGRLNVEHGRVTCHQGLPTIFFRRQWSEAFKYSRPLARWLDRNVGRFDVVHVHAVFSHACLATAAACRRAGVPYLVRPLGTLDPWSLRQKRLQKRLLWRLGVARMLGDAAAIHYTTAEEQRLAERSLGLDRGVVVPLGVDERLLTSTTTAESFRQRYPALGERPYLLTLTRLHPKKGLELLLESFLDLTATSEFDHWCLVIAGDGVPEYVASLRRLAEQWSASRRVLFTGWLEGELKIAALRGAALMALPSRQENFALSVVEALASGVPVLVSPEVNLASQIQAAGAGWVAPLERAALQQTLAEALRDAAERRRRGQAGRGLAVDRFTWPVVARELRSLYQTLVQPAPAPRSAAGKARGSRTGS